ncbi:putative ribonuclease H-like domain-containing protein [Tanacetum coccineum]
MLAFISENTSSTNDVSTAYSVSNTSGQNSQYEQTSSYSLLANQSSCPQLDHEDLEQLDEFDLEEMDLKWQERRSGKQEDSKALVTIDGEGVDWTSHSEEEEDYALMACNSSGSDTEVTSCSNECKESYAKLKKLYDAQREQLSDASIEIKVLGWDHRYDGILSYENEVLQSVFLNKESELEKQPLYDRFVTAGGMHVVPPPMIGNYMPSGPDVEIDYSQFTYGPNQSQPSESETQTSDFDTCESDCSVETHESLPEPTVNEPKVVNQPKVRSDAPIIEEYESDNEDEYVPQPTKEQEQPNFASTNKQVKTPRKTVKNQFTHSKNPTVDKKGLGYGFTARACFLVLLGGKGKLLLSPQQVVIGDKKDITGKISLNTIVDQDYLHRTLKHKGIIDSGCSRHMSGNKAYLAAYQDFNRGPVAFGGSKGYITGKGKQHKASCKAKSVSSISHSLQLLHMDLFGPTSLEALRKGICPRKEDLHLLAGAWKASSTNTVNTVSTPVSTASPYDGLSFPNPTYPDQDNSEIRALEDIYKNPTDGIFTNSSYDDEGDFTNLETVVNVSHIPTLRINSIHPSTLILGDPQSTVQTRSKVSKRRSLKQLEDESWVDAMQEELLQFKIQKVWILIDLPYGKKAIGTKWVDRNKQIKEREEFVVPSFWQIDMERSMVSHLQGCIDPKYPQKVYKVCESLDGLHQAPRPGELTFFLGLQVKQKEDGIFISQDKYVAEILKKFDFVSVKTASTPIETQKPLVKDEAASDVDSVLVLGGVECPHFDWKPTQDSDYVGANLDRKSTTGERFLTIVVTNFQDVHWVLRSWEEIKTHNMVAYLEKTEGNAEFHEISAKSKIINNVRYITAKVAGKPVSISESSIRSDLLFHDADGIDSLPNQAIFDAIQLMGYEGDLIVLAFNKALFSPQWRFLFITSIILVNVPVPLDHFPVNALTSKVFSFMVKSVGRKSTKAEPSVHIDPLFDELDDDEIDNMDIEDVQDVGRIRNGVNSEKEGTEDAFSTEDAVSTDKGKKTSIDDQRCIDKEKEDKRSANSNILKLLLQCLEMMKTPFLVLLKEQAKAVFQEKRRKAVELRMLEETERPRPTSTRSLLTLKPLLKIDLKDKGKKKIEEEDESMVKMLLIVNNIEVIYTDRYWGTDSFFLYFLRKRELIYYLLKKEIQHLKAQIIKLKKQAKPIIKHHRAWLKSVSLKQRLTRKSFSKKQRVHKESVSKQGRKFAKGESSVQRDPLFDEIPEDTVDHMETENAQDVGRTREMVDEDKEIDENILSTEDVLSTDKEGVSTDMEKVSTDRPIVSTDGSKVSTDRQIEGTDEQNEGTEEQIEGTEEQIESTDGQRKGTEDHTEEGSATQATQTPTSTIFGDDETIAKVLLNMSQAKAVSREKEKGVELKDIEETDRPRPTSTRSLLTLKPLPKIDPKDKGKKKIEEEDESESESDGIPEAEKKFKQLESDEEMARKIQEEWEGEEERNRIAEEKATNEALIRNFDDIKARIEADRLLAEKLSREEDEKFTIEERAKFLMTQCAQRKIPWLNKDQNAIRNSPTYNESMRNQ